MNGKNFIFPRGAIPHTEFGLKHAFIMAAVNSAIKDGAKQLNILEVGSWLGASTLLWAESILRFGNEEIAKKSRIVCVDSWNPILCSEDLKRVASQQFVGAAKDDFAYNAFRHNVSLGEDLFMVKIDHVRGASEEVLHEFDGELFDIVYIDASHYYDDVVIDLDLSRGLVKAGGILCGDDLNLTIHDIDISVATLNKNRDYIFDDPNGSYYHPGVTLAVGEMFPEIRLCAGTCAGFWSVKKTSDGSFTPNAVGFDGMFTPSFLTHDEKKSFREEVGKYYP